MTDYYFYPKKTHTGGSQESTDGIDGSLLKDGDAVFCVDPTTRKLDVLTLDSDSAADEDSPRVIKPDVNAGDKRFVKVKTHDGLHEYLSYYTNFEAAIAGIGATVKTLVVDVISTVVLDCTVPSTLTLEVRRGCILTIADTKTLTINGKFICGAYQAFAGTGTVTFGALSTDHVRPNWWGTFPDGNTNGVSDTALLNKAILAAKEGDGAYERRIVVDPGRYYIVPNTMEAIHTSFDAPGAFFIPAVESVETDYIFNFDFSVEIYQRIVNIGGITGSNPLVDTTHYGIGMMIYAGDNSIFNVGLIQGLYVGVYLNAAIYDKHIGINVFNLNTVAGCDTGIALAAGQAANSEVEGNHFNVVYMTWNKINVQCYSVTSDQVLYQNTFDIKTMELHGFDDAVGFFLTGPVTISNLFKVTGSLIPPTGTGTIVTTADDAAENIFELCYIDWALMALLGGFNVFRQDGKANTVYPALLTNTTARSTIMSNAAPASYPWRQGDKVYMNAPANNGTLGWVCTANGTTGNNGAAATWRKFGSIYLEGNAAWNIPEVAHTGMTHGDITIAGAVLGDFAVASLSNNSALMCMSATVTAANTVKVVLLNASGNNVTVGNTTLYVRVLKR